MARYARAGQWTEYLLTYKMAVKSAHLRRANSYPLRHLDSNQKGGGGVKSGRADAIKPGGLGLSCKANKCSDAGSTRPR